MISGANLREGVALSQSGEVYVTTTKPTAGHIPGKNMTAPFAKRADSDGAVFVVFL